MKNVHNLVRYLSFGAFSFQEPKLDHDMWSDPVYVSLRQKRLVALRFEPSIQTLIAACVEMG